MDNNPRLAFLAREVLVLLNEQQGTFVPAYNVRHDLLQRAEPLTPEESKQGSSGRKKFMDIVENVVETLIKAGWIEKAKQSSWKITEEGTFALAAYATETDLYRAANDKAKNYARAVEGTPADDPAEEQDGFPEPPAKTEAGPSLVPPPETPRKRGKESWASFYWATEQKIADYIAEFLANVHAHEFEQIMTTLLKAMGYHIQWTAPEKGADGGIDIMACRDPFGMDARLKVQCKRWKEKAGIVVVKSFAANVEQNDVGLVVCTGGFTPDAENWVKTQPRPLVLINREKLVSLWIEHCEKLTEKEREIFPLRATYILTPKQN
jgi:restriction system protein